MINVSAEFKELMQSRTDFKQHAEITLADGAVWALDETDFTISNNSLTDAAEANELPLGVAVGRTIQIELMNDTDQFKDVAFLGAEIRLYLTFQLSETIEEIELGVFTVISPETYGETVIISAVDNMYKLDKDYATAMTFPQTLGAIFRDSCNRCGVLFESATFNNYDFVVDELPENVGTHRQMIGYIAMIAGGNARFNRSGKLEILTYSFPNIETAEKTDFDGGTFEDWDSGDDLDGGDFTDWTSSDTADGGTFDPWSSGSGSSGITVDDDTHLLKNWANLRIDTEDLVITGIQTTATQTDDEGNETKHTILYGAEGYVISIDNPLIVGKEDEAVALIGDVLVGAAIRKFEGDHIGYPLAEFMDKAIIIDRKGNAAPTILTDIAFNFFGKTAMKNSAAAPLRLSSKYNSAAAQAVIAAKNLVAKERTQREQAIKSLNDTLKTSSGMYSTEDVQEDGSTIYYLHDKPTIAESRNVMKLTAEAIGFSTDGGETYPFGFTITGDMVLKVLQARGVNADWITTGALTITDEDGNVLFSADIDSKSVSITGNILQIISDYFTLAKDGKITATGGTIGGFTIDRGILHTSDHTNPAGDYVPGVVLDTENGVISVGSGVMKSNAVGQVRFGTENYYILFNDGTGNFTYNINVNGSTLFRDEVYFGDTVTFNETPKFPTLIPVTEGGTGKDSFTSNAVLIGNGTGALKAVSTLQGVLRCDSDGGLPYFGAPTVGARSNSTSVPANSTASVTIDYGYTFSSTPAVVPSVQHDSTHEITCRLKTVGTSSCEVLVVNNSSSSASVYVHIIATER